MKIKKYIFALISALTFTLNYEAIYESGLKSIFTDKFLILRIVLFVMLFLLLILIYGSMKKSKYVKALSMLFAIFLLVGESYRLYGSFLALFKPVMLIFTIIKYFGYCFMIYKIIEYIIIFNKYYKRKKFKDNKLFKTFDKHPFLFAFITIIISWSIYYIAFYPIVLSPDPSFQIKQFLGERTKYLNYSIPINDNVTITNHHPVFHTALLGSFAKLGLAFNNVNIGLFAYSLLQGIILALTLCYTIAFLKKKGLETKYLLIILLSYAFIPMFPLYALNGNKDVFYSIFVIHLLILLFDFIYNKKEEKISFKKIISWFFVMLFICLFRNNGIFIIIFLFPLLLIFSKLNKKAFLVIFLSVISLFFTYEHVLIPSLGITGTSIRESLSICFQQTARYVNTYESELSFKDKEIIGKVLDYNELVNYNPILADPVKNTYNRYATKNDLKNYFGVWYKGFIRHPLLYIDATLNNTYGYFDPGDKNWYVYTTFDDRITKNNLTNYHYNNLSVLRSVLEFYANMYPAFPVLGFFTNIGFCLWCIIAYTVYLLKKKLYKYLIFLEPAYISILVCFASPANTYFRYAMPYAFSIFFILATWHLIKEKKSL